MTGARVGISRSEACFAMEVGIMALVALLAMAGAWLRAFFAHQVHRAEWARAGRTLGLSLHGGLLPGSVRLKGPVSGFPVEVKGSLRVDEHGSTRASTTYRVRFRQPAPVGFTLRSQWKWNRAARRGERRVDVEVGEEGFDRGVWVEGEDARRIVAYLTSQRRGRILRLLSSYKGCTITSHGLSFRHRSVARAERLVTAIRSFVEAAQVLESRDGEPERLDRVTALREEGEIEEALELVEEEVGESPDRIEARQLVADLHRLAGRQAEEREARRRAIEEIGLEGGEWELPEPIEDAVSDSRGAAPTPPPSPSPAPMSPEEVGEWLAKDSAAEPDPTRAATIDEIARDLFAPDTSGSEREQRFEQRFAGRPIQGAGRVSQVLEPHFDVVFGEAPGVKATVVLGAIEDEFGLSNEMRAVAFFPGARIADFDALVGEQLAFRGRLLRCDPYLRTLYVADAERELAAPA